MFDSYGFCSNPGENTKSHLKFGFGDVEVILPKNCNFS